jgi:CheY-like chemotaxis protein
MTSTSARKISILVVDNGEDVAKTTAAMLEQLGYRAQAEVESLAGLRAFSDEPERFDLAIIEPAMPELFPRSARKNSPLSPELTGLELAVRFRRIKQGLPVLFCAKSMGPALAEEIKAAGFPEPVLKPLTSRELDEMIQRVSSRHVSQPITKS